MTEDQLRRYCRRLKIFRDRVQRVDLKPYLGRLEVAPEKPSARLEYLHGESYTLHYSSSSQYVQLSHWQQGQMPSVLERGPRALYSFQEQLGVDFAEDFIGLEILLGDD